MKALERIFLYSVLAILVFYVFLVDNKVESQVAIQEEIRARYIAIVNDEGREVVMLSADNAGHGGIIIYNKDGTVAASMMAREDGGMIGSANKAGALVAIMGVTEDDNGLILVANKVRNCGAIMDVNENDNGEIRVYSKDGKEIGSLP